MTTAQLIAAFHAHHFKMGPKIAAKIITYAQKVLLPDPEVVTIRAELFRGFQVFNSGNRRSGVLQRLDVPALGITDTICCHQ